MPRLPMTDKRGIFYGSFTMDDCQTAVVGRKIQSAISMAKV